MSSGILQSQAYFYHGKNQSPENQPAPPLCRSSRRVTAVALSARPTKAVVSLQTLYLASMLIKALWNNALAAKAQLSKQSSFASLLNTNMSMGNKKGQLHAHGKAILPPGRGAP